MIAVFRKEIASFFSSIIAYVVIGVFLLANGIFMWIIPETGIFETGYATLDPLFELAPWVFMFLVPAITMRSFAEERKTGTFETLVTKPLSDYQVIFGKYLANLALVLFSLIPTLLYFLTVFLLAVPVGNMDLGGTWGSFLGLFFLGAIYVAIGLFSSVINDNQIISFIISLFLCFLFYTMIDMLRGINMISPLDPILEYLSINTHYMSISRGVLDTRDIIYFISFVAFFTVLTKLIIERRKW